MIQSEDINGFVEDIKSYIEAKSKLLKIEAAEMTSDSISEFISYLLVGLIGFMFLFMVSILGGISISVWLDDYLIGFSLVSAFYLLLFLILILFRKPLIKRAFQNRIIKYIFKKEEDEPF